MKQVKDISINEHNFLLLYNDAKTNVNDITKTNCHNLIWVDYIPKNDISEKEGILICNEHENHLMEEIKKVVEENKEFYDNFVVRYHFSNGCSHIAPYFGKTLLIKIERHLDIKLKKDK